MPIFRAIGFGIMLIILRLMLPDVFHEANATAVSFLHGAQLSADTASSIAASASQAASSAHGTQGFTNFLAPPALHASPTNSFALPQTPNISIAPN